MNNSSIQKKGISFISIFIFPIFSLFISFKNFRQPEAKNLFWFFCMFLGMIHIFNPHGGSLADGTRYAEHLQYLHNQVPSWSNFKSLMFNNDGYSDIYQPLVTYIIALFSDNAHWLFFIFATIFGFFYSRNIWFILNNIPSKPHFSLIILIALYILLCPIWNINGVRMWTALQVFIYGALPYLYNKDKSKLVWALLSILIHFSFIIPVLILTIYYFVPKKIIIIFLFFLFSFFLKEIDIPFIRDSIISYLPDFLLNRTILYVNDDVLQRLSERQVQLSFHVILSEFIINYFFIVVSLIIVIRSYQFINNNKVLNSLFCFSFFLYGVSNLLSLVPSGSRFIVLSRMFLLSAIIFFIILSIKKKYTNTNMFWINFFCIPLIIPVFFYLRMGLDYYGISLFLNPIFVLFINDNIPIIDLIKSL